MIFNETELPGVYVVDVETIGDRRGHFARAFCAGEFEKHGLEPRVAQCNLSYNHAKGTLRGLHFQKAPHEETKLVRCTRGAIFDVAVDLRPDSPTFKKWTGVELSAENSRMLYVPAGFAHGYLTLTNGAEVFYMVSQFYAPASEGGYRWDDPAFGIDWPAPVEVVSDKDAAHPDFQD